MAQLQAAPALELERSHQAKDPALHFGPGQTIQVFGLPLHGLHLLLHATLRPPLHMPAPKQRPAAPMPCRVRVSDRPLKARETVAVAAPVKNAWSHLQ